MTGTLDSKSEVICLINQPNLCPSRGTPKLTSAPANSFSDILNFQMLLHSKYFIAVGFLRQGVLILQVGGLSMVLRCD